MGAALLFAAMLCSLAPAVVFGSSAKWVRLTPPTVDGRNVWSLYDSNRDRELIVGAASIWAVSSDVIPKWTQIWSGTFDWSRSSSIHAMFYDPGRDRIWAFSSTTHGTTLTFPGELWTMDLGVTPLTWTQRSFSNLAPFTTGFDFAFDQVRDRVLVFEGSCTDCGPITGVDILSLSGTPTWTNKTVAGTAPDPRIGTTAIYDPVRDRMLLYGGINPGRVFPLPQIPATIYDETWALSLAEPMTWFFLTPTNRVAYARWRASGGYDVAGKRMIVTAGYRDPSEYAPMADTWALDLSPSAPADSAVWTPVRDPQPPLRDAPIAWVDSSHSRLLRFGGVGSDYPATARLDTWSLSLGTVPAWSAIWADSLPAPPRFGQLAMADRTGASWFVGLGDPADVVARSSDFTAAAPWRTAAIGGPTAPFWARGARDEAGSRELVFGGGTSKDATALASESSDLWAFDLVNAGWSLIPAVGGPPARADALTLFDPVRRHLIVHGGRYSAPGKVRPRTDTWMYDVATNTWSSLGSASFGGRWSEAGIYDPVRDRMIAFGGKDSVNTWADVHVLPLAGGGTWSPLPTTGTPPYGSSAQAAYDAPGDRMIVVAQGDTSLDVYALSLDANPTWSRVAVDGEAPATRQDFAAAPDVTGQAMLVSGGRGYYLTGVDDSWILAFDEATTTVSVSVVSTDARPGLVRIHWRAQQFANVELHVYRRGAKENWRMIASLVPDGAGDVSLEDTNVVPGEQYDYRLGAVLGGSEHFFAEATVQVPAAGAFRLEGARPNPATGELSLTFALADGDPATLEILDVGGRIVYTRAVGSMGAGDHVLRVSRLTPGLYFAHLRHAGQEQVVKLVVTR